MAKVYQGELPKNIYVVVDGKVLTVARFNDEGIYETDNKEVLAELKRYGYEVETVKEAKKLEKEPEPKPIVEPEPKPVVEPEPKPKVKQANKKGVK